MTDPENILDVLSSLQAEINDLKAKNEKYESQLNQFRLGVFIPSTLPEIDIRPIATRCSWAILDILKQPDGLEISMNIQRCIIEIAAECSDSIEQWKSKSDIKIKLSDIDKKKKAEVEKQRKKSSPEGKKERVLLTDAEKAVRGIMKMHPGASQKELLPWVKVFIPGMTEEDATGVLESLFLKLAKAQSAKG